jgi:hypothetical protein
MGNQHAIWLKSHVTITWKEFLSLSTWTILKTEKNSKNLLNGWKRIKKFSQHVILETACWLLNQMRNSFVRMALGASAGVRKATCARVEKKKAQICRLSLLNIVRCYREWIASFNISPCGLTRNILVRCYV